MKNNTHFNDFTFDIELFCEEVVTTHAFERSKQRLGLSRSRTRKSISNAWRYGKRIDSYTSKKEVQYLKDMSRDSICTVYNNFLYVFSDDLSDGIVKCITVHSLPKWFGSNKKRAYNGKNHISNYRKYYKKYIANEFNEDFEEYKNLGFVAV